MATTKARKAPKAKKAPAAAKGPKKTRVINGVRYKHDSCSNTKTAASSTAKAYRAKGPKKKARVVKVGGKYCVYTRG